jgi:hypothetical protein
MGSFDDNIPLTRINPTKPWDRRLPRRDPRDQKSVPAPKPVKKPGSRPSDPDTGSCHIDEYA